VVEQWIHANVRREWGTPCIVDFVEDEPWMALTEHYVEEDCDLQVTIDATDLGVGTYYGTVRSMSDCVECARIVLEVESSSGIPGDPSTYVQTSWGKIKSLYK